MSIVKPMHSSAWLEGGYDDELELLAAIVHEGINLQTASTVEFTCADAKLDLTNVVGRAMSVCFWLKEGEKRAIHGMCVSAAFQGLHGGIAQFTAEIRPWLWYLTRARNCRVYQKLTVLGIIEDVLSRHGFWGNVQNKTTASYSQREYCIQYRETDLDFITRLMEEEGIYFFFEHEDGLDKLVLADSESAHQPVLGDDKIPYRDFSSQFESNLPHIYQWDSHAATATKSVTLDDYNFEKPRADLRVQVNTTMNDHSKDKLEIYDTPGHYRETELGDAYAKVKIEAEEARVLTCKAATNTPNIEVGRTFTLIDHPREAENAKYLVTKATYHLRAWVDKPTSFQEKSDLDRLLAFEEGDKDYVRVTFEAVPGNTVYRAQQVTSWPEIPGIQTAVVVGPSGEEIYTDKYGRVLVQFHWDREGKKDQNSSCWVRTMMPWTGKQWGMIAIPRIGNEVVVQFEEGDPDRPIIVGMLYNADNMPPYGLPANMTQSGVKTNSTKNGNGYNELMFEDKKGAELVRFKSERNYQQIVQNDATITVGLEDKDKGDMSLTVYHDMTETIKTGDVTFAIEQGNESRSIAKDQSQSIGANQTETVGKDLSQSVGSNYDQTVGTNSTINIGSNSDITIGSNSDITIGSNLKTTVASNIKETAGQKIAINAGVEIKLSVGASSIKIDNSGVTITGINVKIDGKAMVKAKSPMTQVSGDAMLILKGGLTVIN